MKILITTGIYPPKIGGPSQYAKNLKEAFERMGHCVVVQTFTVEDFLPTGIRHAFFFFKILPELFSSDLVFTLDTFSVGLPTALASKIIGKKCIVRTGGDFLWEQYVERTQKKVLLRLFYKTESKFFIFKEKVVFRLTKWILNNVYRVIFSTDWQRNIFTHAYGIKLVNTGIVENFYGPKEESFESHDKVFIASTRALKWKNIEFIKRVFEKIKINDPSVILFTDNLPYKDFMELMKKSYAVILVSLGDISPNMILDAIRLNKPFICTREVGIYDRIKDAGVFVDPLNQSDVEEKVRYLLTENGYRESKDRVSKFDFFHTWDHIAKEFLTISK